jgi:hypothetical protein
VSGAVETVAVLALTYRTMWRNCYSTPAALDDELEQTSDPWLSEDGSEDIIPPAPGGVSLLGMIGSQSLEELDWELIEAMPIHDGGSFVDLAELGRDLAKLSPERCEALLHAWPQDPRGDLANEQWSEPYIERWAEVSAAIAKLEPLTWDREQCDEMALAAAGPDWWKHPDVKAPDVEANG